MINLYPRTISSLILTGASFFRNITPQLINNLQQPVSYLPFSAQTVITPLVTLASTRSMPQAASRVCQLVLRLNQQGSGPTTPRKRTIVNQMTSGIARTPSPRTYTSHVQTQSKIRISAGLSRSFISTLLIIHRLAQTVSQPEPPPGKIIIHPDTPKAVGESRP
jgi:hypothetical protein